MDKEKVKDLANAEYKHLDYDFKVNDVTHNTLQNNRRDGFIKGYITADQQSSKYRAALEEIAKYKSSGKWYEDFKFLQLMANEALEEGA